MERGTGTAVLSQVDAVRRRIEGWRAMRASGSPMPEELWSAAVELAREHGVYVVARSLRVDYGALKRRVDGDGGARRDGMEGAVGGFVELRSSAFLGVPPAGGMEVELCGVDGARLVIRGAGREAVDVVGLAESFWRRGA